MGIIYSAASKPIYPSGANCVAEDTLTAGNSPYIIDVLGTLTYNGNRGYVKNDDTTNSFSVQISNSVDDYHTAFTLNAGEAIDLTGMDICQIQLTRGSADVAFRVQVW